MQTAAHVEKIPTPTISTIARLRDAVLLLAMATAAACEPETPCTETATCVPAQMGDAGSDQREREEAGPDQREREEAGPDQREREETGGDRGDASVADVSADASRDRAEGGGAEGGSGRSDASGDADGGEPGTVDAAIDRGSMCPTGQKLCSGACVATTDPATGCAEAACTPCSFPNATAVCGASGQCAIGTCSAGFGNCNTTDPKDGCETDLSKADTCGSCTTKCGTSAPLCSGSNGSYQCVSGCTAPTSTLCGSQCVDVNTNATHCGDCTTSCMTPTNGDALCANKMCDYTCRIGYHKCTATLTCADDNSPATCGTSCSPCPAPTDPNADPMATCVNKQCGFKCKTGYNLCSGVCSDPSSVLTCGPNCTACTKPGNASAATCNGTTCGFICNPGYEPSGTQCIVATNLYVSTSGSDANLGTQASPFRTWKRAAQLAQSGTTVNFAAGTYDAAGGDDFTDAIPNGVTLQRSGAGTVVLSADGQHSLVFTGSATLANLTLNSFHSALTATAGTQTIKGVTITNPKSAVSVTGNAFMSISDNSSVTGSAGQAYLFSVDGSGQLALTDTTGATTSTTSDCLSAGGLVAKGSATVTLSNYTCAGNVWPCVLAQGSAVLNISNSTLLSGCGGGIALSGNASLSSTNTSLSGLVANDTTIVNVNGGAITTSGGGLGIRLGSTGRSAFHGCRFDQQVTLYGAAADFGSGGGNNIFNAGLNVQAPSINVIATGNKWIPNEQGADGNGIMPSTAIIGPVDGRNVTVVATSLVTM